MKTIFARFKKDDEGAVTVDWVVLTAAIVGLGIAMMSLVESGARSLATETRNHLINQNP